MVLVWYSNALHLHSYAVLHSFRKVFDAHTVDLANQHYPYSLWLAYLLGVRGAKSQKIIHLHIESHRDNEAYRNSKLIITTSFMKNPVRSEPLLVESPQTLPKRRSREKRCNWSCLKHSARERRRNTVEAYPRERFMLFGHRSILRVRNNSLTGES